VLPYLEVAFEYYASLFDDEVRAPVQLLLLGFERLPIAGDSE